MKRAVTLAVVAVVLLASSACQHSSPGVDEARLRVDPASSVTVAAGGATRVATGSHLIRSGSVVRVISGHARFDLAAGGQVELRGGSTVRVGRPIDLLAGEALVTSGTRAVAMRADGTNLAVTGVSRLGRSLAVSAQSYRGTTDVESAGRSLVVPALRRTTVPDLGLVAARATPISVDPSSSDEWDRRYLGVALDLTPELEARSAGFTGAAADVVQAFPIAGSLQLPARPGDALVGAAVVVAGARGTVESRWRDTFEFRGQGAAWGLVVLDQRLIDPYGPARLVQDALTRLFRAATPVAGGAPAGLAAAAAPPAQSPGATPSSSDGAIGPSGTTTPTNAGPTSPVPPVTQPPAPAVPAGPSAPTPLATGTPVDAILDPILGTGGASTKQSTPIVTITTPIVTIAVL